MPLGGGSPYRVTCPLDVEGDESLEADVGKPLLDVLRDVVLDPVEQAAFTDDPSAYLGQYGYEDVAPDDLSEAFGLVADTLPPDVAQAVASTAPAAAPVEDLVDDAEGGAFGEVTQDFDAVADGAEALVADDDLGADFGTGEVGTGEVAEVEVDIDDVDAFGVGSEADGGFGGGSEGVAFTSTSPTDTFDDSFDDGDFGAEAVDGVGVDDDGVPGVDVPDEVDGTADGSYDGGDDDLGDHLGDVELPDDPGDFLDDIGSF